SESLDRFPNLTVETGARVGELGRQPRTSRRFFEKYQDRIFLGTDAVPPPDGNAVPQQVFKDELYEIYFRFLETEDEYFDYAPAPVPPQGRWRIYGIGLPESILKKVYHDNAARILGLASRPGRTSMSGGAGLVTLRAMTPADIPDGLRLSEAAGWNQRESDWRFLLEGNPGRFVVALRDGAGIGRGGAGSGVAGSCVTEHYAPGSA